MARGPPPKPALKKDSWVLWRLPERRSAQRGQTDSKRQIELEWDAFKNPDDSNTWKEKNNDYCFLDENSICRLFFCNDEQDVWEYFASGYGNYLTMVEYYYSCNYNDGDDSVLPFLMYLINHYDQLVYFYTRKRYQSVPRYNEVIALLKDYYEMYSDSFFSQENISTAKEVWETGIEELRVEFVKSEEGLKILKQIL